ncbi:PAS domain S-box protein [Pseudaminobacter sp. 19-2017]|uniref:Blue-light-activated histidine kinase n=1 Tax=Pseudaminobacter soli (ex Zhang et al. 2022) TaxID=2831468 RepID=A0A942E2F5_9HYPH|nr:PAS domain S-box protein [Pseudaminobacter soli]MBS3652574.1 PAS domain S-box protein [Pseudaminobacter soli]
MGRVVLGRTEIGGTKVPSGKERRICRSETPAPFGSGHRASLGRSADSPAESTADASAIASTSSANHHIGPSLAILRALPEPVYMTDSDGRLTFFNDAVARLWNRHPEIGSDGFSWAWTLFWPDGRPMAYAESPMAAALKEKRVNRGREVLIKRPNGERVTVLAFPTPLFDHAGNLTGAVNMLIDVTDRSSAHGAAQRFAAIVQSSDDAIFAKSLNGTITSWNRGAERLFGYSAEEIVGKPVAALIPPDRHDEEPNILSRIKAGDAIDHYETIRRRKDGTLVEISLSVSPIRNPEGRVVGASKIARDITERRRAEEQQHLLIKEMDHRVKNLFSLASSIVSLSKRSVGSADELAGVVLARLGALAQAHALTIPTTSTSASRAEQATTLHTLIRTLLAAYDENHVAVSRFQISGPDVEVCGGAVTGFALVFHEFATNAAKYGALSVPNGRLVIECETAGEQLTITWSERGGPPVAPPADGDGFGTLLTRGTVRGQLGGEISREWKPEGLVITLSVDGNRLNG